MRRFCSEDKEVVRRDWRGKTWVLLLITSSSRKEQTQQRDSIQVISRQPLKGFWLYHTSCACERQSESWRIILATSSQENRERECEGKRTEGEGVKDKVVRWFSNITSHYPCLSCPHTLFSSHMPVCRSLIQTCKTCWNFLGISFQSLFHPLLLTHPLCLLSHTLSAITYGGTSVSPVTKWTKKSLFL